MPSSTRSEMFLPSRDANGVRWEKQSVMSWLSSLEGGSSPLLAQEQQAEQRLVPPLALPEGTPTHPRYWDLSYIWHTDPHCSLYLTHLGALAVKYEDGLSRQHQQQEAWNEYQTMQHRLYFLFDRITSQYPPQELRGPLDALYQETIDKLNFHLTGNSEHRTPLLPSRAGVEPVTQRNASYAGPSQGQQSSITAPARTTTPKANPADLGTYMTDWLRDNFTNPYPDETGLDEMAKDCGTTTTIIGNWLINARTRKWRPAIVQATELNRPADCLLEDALRIFNGEKVAAEQDDMDGMSRKRLRG